MTGRGFDAAEFSARVRLHAGRYVAFQVRNQLQELLRADFDPALLTPLPTPVEEAGPPEADLKRQPDPCPYSYLLRTDYMRPQVLDAWQAVASGTLRIECAVRDLVTQVSKINYDLNNASRRITREGQKIRRSKWREQVASTLIGKALIPVRALTQVITGDGVCKAGEIFELSPINILEEVWGWASRSTPNRYFDIPSQTIVGKRTNDCVLILDAVGKRAFEAQQRGQERREAVQIYLDALQAGAVDLMAGVPTEFRDLCARVDPISPQWPMDEPSGISQNELLNQLTGGTRGKRQKRIIGLIRGLLKLDLVQRKGKGRTAHLVLGPGPRSKRCPD